MRSRAFWLVSAIRASVVTVRLIVLLSRSMSLQCFFEHGELVGGHLG